MIIQRYAATLVLSISVMSCAMDSEHEDQNLKNHVIIIRGQIDQKILGINDYAWHTSLVGSCKSFYRSFSFYNNPQEAVKQLSAVETVMQEASDFRNPSLLFEALHKKHWHFAYLVNALVDDEVEQLRQVNSSTIDTLCDTGRRIRGLSDLLSRFIHTRAHDCYAQEVKIKEHIAHIHFGGENADQEEIHCTLLEAFGHTPCTLIMSDDGKYIRSMSSRGKSIIWDVQAATETEISLDINSQDKQCFRNDYLIDANDSMLATCGEPYGAGWRLWSIARKYQKAHDGDILAMLFARPTLTSWLCQQIFLKSSDDKNELIKLRDSNAVKSLKGFPQKNLLNLIDNALRNIPEQTEKK